MSLQIFDYAMGLGPTCRTGFQIRRVFGKTRCIPTVFDRQVTPPSTILEYFRRDFIGFMEPEDLIGRDPVRNAKFGTQHFHEFGKSGGAEEGFANARLRHDRFCTLARKLLRGPRSILFVVQKNAHGDFPSALHRIIAWRYAKLNFDVVEVTDEARPDRPPGLEWKGTDLAWTEGLAGYGIRPSILGTRYEVQRRVSKHLFGSP